MANIKETFMEKYGWGEYLLFILGAVVLGHQVYSYLTGTLEGDMLDGIMALAGIFCVTAPMTMLDLARKKAGLETKGD